ncbi:MAG: hypothetical protein ABI721_02545 [Candidatus Dojkabacteria bacterium]
MLNVPQESRVNIDTHTNAHPMIDELEQTFHRLKLALQAKVRTAFVEGGDYGTFDFFREAISAATTVQNLKDISRQFLGNDTLSTDEVMAVMIDGDTGTQGQLEA